MKLDHLLQIPTGQGAIHTRGGFFDPSLNVWIASEMPTLVNDATPATLPFLQAMAEVAVAAGQLHLQQLEDAKSGKIWPLPWLRPDAAPDVVRFCRQYPTAASPYACVTLDPAGAVTYTHRYRNELAELDQALARLLALDHEAVGVLAPYLTALRHAFRFEHA